MIVRFYFGPDSPLPHVLDHGVTPAEVLEVLQGKTFRSRAKDGPRAAEGQTLQGRLLRVIYREDPIDGSLFVITAYDLHGNAKKAFRRRKRKRS